MAVNFHKSIEVIFPCDYKSPWSVSFTSSNEGVLIGLHYGDYGDKDYAAHSVSLSHGEFQSLLTQLQLGE